MTSPNVGSSLIFREAKIRGLTSLRLLKAALMRDLIFFTRVKKSRQKKALFPDKANLMLHCQQDFSIRHPWRIEKRRASCPPPDGSGNTAAVHRDEGQYL
jgi:hypothetical protein